MLAEMRDAGVDIEAHSETHQDLRKPYDKVRKKRLNPAEYEQWLKDEIVGSKELLEQKLGIKVDCFAVPYGFYNKHIEEVCRNAGYQAVFTVYGQPITFTSPMLSLGRYLIEANKPKVFTDAVNMIATSTGGATAVAQVGASALSTQPADGVTIRTDLPLIKANLSSLGPIDPKSVRMRVSGLGLVAASFDPRTGVVSYQVTQKLKDKTITVIVSAESQGKKVETHWAFGIEQAGETPAPKQ
jgi:Polysaccharide deacetylase